MWKVKKFYKIKYKASISIRKGVRREIMKKIIILIIVGALILGL